MNKNFNDLTILLVSFRSDEQILRLISKLLRKSEMIFADLEIQSF